MGKTFFGMEDRFTDKFAEPDLKPIRATPMDTVSVPSNDDDIDGIERYIGWHLYKAGMSSTVFHYLGVLVKKARG